jgi:hypothetical protein
MCVANAGMTISHLLLNSGLAILESGPKRRDSKPSDGFEVGCACWSPFPVENAAVRMFSSGRSYDPLVLLPVPPPAYELYALLAAAAPDLLKDCLKTRDDIDRDESSTGPRRSAALMFDIQDTGPERGRYHK